MPSLIDLNLFDLGLLASSAEDGNPAPWESKVTSRVCFNYPTTKPSDSNINLLLGLLETIIEVTCWVMCTEIKPAPVWNLNVMKPALRPTQLCCALGNSTGLCSDRCISGTARQEAGLILLTHCTLK